MDLNDLHKVWEVKVLEKKPRKDEARRILERISKQVQPIMRSHKWKVKLLAEFCPSNPALLGLNVGGGAAVKLRLRSPRFDSDFLPYEQILDTMLHELCHIEHGPHNAAFYRLWDEIRKECEDLIATGVTGTGRGFDLPGRRLGGFSRQPPLSALRQTVLAAAQKRQRTGSLLPCGPNRLGGDADIMTSLSPIQAAAMAAERRMQDDIWCGSCCGEHPTSVLNDSCLSENLKHDGSGTSSSSSLGAVTKNNVHLPGGSSEVKHDGVGSAIDRVPSHDNLSDGYVQPSLVGGAIWECSTCTLINKPLSLVCEACGSKRLQHFAPRSKVWACRFCTLENGIELDKCLACEQWRYSYGAPVSARVLNLDT